MALPPSAAYIPATPWVKAADHAIKVGASAKNLLGSSCFRFKQVSKLGIYFSGLLSLSSTSTATP